MFVGIIVGKPSQDFTCPLIFFFFLVNFGVSVLQIIERKLWFESENLQRSWSSLEVWSSAQSHDRAHLHSCPCKECSSTRPRQPEHVAPKCYVEHAQAHRDCDRAHSRWLGNAEALFFYYYYSSFLPKKYLDCIGATTKLLESKYSRLT